MKTSVWSLTCQQSVFQRYYSEKHLSEFYPQDSGESQLASKLRHCRPMTNDKFINWSDDWLPNPIAQDSGWRFKFTWHVYLPKAVTEICDDASVQNFCVADTLLTINVSLFSLLAALALHLWSHFTLARPSVSSLLRITDRSIHYASLRLWYQLPACLRQAHHSYLFLRLALQSIHHFPHPMLKTFLFHQFFLTVAFLFSFQTDSTNSRNHPVFWPYPFQFFILFLPSWCLPSQLRQLSLASLGVAESSTSFG